MQTKIGRTNNCLQISLNCVARKIRSSEIEILEKNNRLIPVERLSVSEKEVLVNKQICGKDIQSKQSNIGLSRFCYADKKMVRMSRG
jgi:hypothetical protein